MNRKTRRKKPFQPQQGRQGYQKKERQKIYESYWSESEVDEGLSNGTLIQGSLKGSFEDGIVPHPNFSAGIYIRDRVDRNRAFNSDIVVVQLHERQKWMVFEKAFEEYEKFKTVGMDNREGKSDRDNDSCSNSEDASEIDENNDSDYEEERDARGGREYSSGSSLVGATAGLNISEGCKARTSSQTAPTQRPDGPARGGRENLNEESTMQKDGGPPAKKKKKSPRKRVEVSSVAYMIKNGSPFAKKFFEDFVHGRLDEEIEEFKFLQRTGKVVYISEKKHPRIASGYLKFTSGKRGALFMSCDRTMTNFIIPEAECPHGFLQRPEEFQYILYEAEIGEWGEGYTTPEGKLTKILGKAGEIEAETKASLIEMKVDDTDFSREVKDCLPTAIPPSAFENRTSLRTLCVFTIDDLKTKDMDDALSIQELEDGIYQVGVHIADVSDFVKEGTELDRVASERATSVYLIQRVIPMLPEQLSDNLCSLVPGEDRLAVSVMWQISAAGEISPPHFDRTVIKSCVRLSFDDAQGFIDHPEKEWQTEELPPITGPFGAKNIKEKVLQLHKLAVNLRKQRIKDGALLFERARPDWKWNEETQKVENFFTYKDKESNRMVREFMVLANVAVAHKIKDKFSDKAILRRQASPKEQQLKSVAKFLDSVDLHFDVRDRQQLQNLLTRGDQEDRIKSKVLWLRMKELMRRAEYFCSGTIKDETEYHHYSLNVPLFTNFTSPIRQYSNIMVHRLLAAALDSTITYPRRTDELQAQVDVCNAKSRVGSWPTANWLFSGDQDLCTFSRLLRHAVSRQMYSLLSLFCKRAPHLHGRRRQVNRVQNDNIDKHFAIFVKEKGILVVPGMVVLVRMNSFDVFIPEYGISSTVALQPLPLESHKYKKDTKCPALEIAWKENDRLTKHHIKLFMLVTCRLTADGNSLKWNCVIERPESD